VRQALVPLLACPACAGPLVCSSQDAVVVSGLLTCACGRWFPIEHQIPEVLPDHLRDWEKDLARFDTLATTLPEDERATRRSFQPNGASELDPGSHYKKAEIGIKAKIDEPLFFVPGQTSPFAPWDPAFTLYLIKLFGISAPLLNLRAGDIVIDSGCGYAWTTEWLFRAGFDPIGVDICRTYLEIGVDRVGALSPHLVVGDVEHLPLRAGIAKGVLAYESFHHVPDRRRAMTQYERVLQDGGTVVLAEPGAAHEQAPSAIAAMTKYGILEKGMELADVLEYAQDTSFAVDQVFLMRLTGNELNVPVDAAFATTHSAIEGNLFKAVKGGAPARPTPVEPPAAKSRFIGRWKERLGRR
jgi:uncharacterized protein YbaR (Trm112 family)/2-polyprenyl-3-methyl-5-hydroxy-6-metoxy-1,4-benzoquinol methylase